MIQAIPAACWIILISIFAIKGSPDDYPIVIRIICIITLLAGVLSSFGVLLTCLLK